MPRVPQQPESGENPFLMLTWGRTHPCSSTAWPGVLGRVLLVPHAAAGQQLCSVSAYLQQLIKITIKTAESRGEFTRRTPRIEFARAVAGDVQFASVQ